MERQKDYDTDKFSVWLDPENNVIHVSLKGSSSSQDIISDLHILANNRSGHETEIQEYLERIVNEFGDDYNYKASGHSLGATELINVFTGERNDVLDKYSEVSVYTPGVSPIHNLDSIKDAYGDERFNFFLNSGDIVSNTAIGLIPDNPEAEIAYGSPTHNPSSNHGLQQFIGDV